METGLIHTHNMLRWLLLIVLLLAIGLAFTGWTGKKEWNKKDKVVSLLLTIFMDIQFLVGIILYAFVSPMTKAAFANFGAAMKNSELRFYAIEHITMMVIALVLVHLGKVKSKKATTPWKKHRVAAIYYTISLLIILAAIPWNRAFI